jgi:hypothetical protein
MAQVAATIDAVRVCGTPDVWVVILKHTVREQYPSIKCCLPIWISQPQAHIITARTYTYEVLKPRGEKAETFLMH